MIVKKIIGLVNQYSNEQLNDEEVVNVVQQSVINFNAASGLIVPIPPVSTTPNALNYDLTFTAKCPNIPDIDPQHKSLQPKIDNFNARMRVIDTTVVGTCIVQYAVAHVKLQKKKIRRFNMWKTQQQVSYNNIISRFSHFWNRDYRLGTTPGSEHVTGGISTLKGAIRQPDPVCNFLRKIGYKDPTTLLGRACCLRPDYGVIWTYR